MIPDFCKLDPLILESGQPIPFNSIQATLHQPRLKDIALIGQKPFFMGCEILTIEKDKVSNAVEDKEALEKATDFDIFMALMAEKNENLKESQFAAYLILTIIFPDFDIGFSQKGIVLTEKSKDSNSKERIIDSSNFIFLSSYLKQICCLENATTQYNPSGDLAKKIADKLAAARKNKKASIDENEFHILSRYSSIVAVGMQLDINCVMEYTMYQLFDIFNRFQLKEVFDDYMLARMIGASGMDEPENWMKDLYDTHAESSKGWKDKVIK